MGEFTYEKKNRTSALERYEWDNVWWEQTERQEALRAAYIGDSISCATRKRITALSGNTLLTDGFGTSKALDNAYFYETLRLFLRQQGYRTVILFNNGLHGWHLEDGGEYAEAYDRMISFLEKECPDIPILILLTTRIADAERNERVKARNRAALSVAKKHGLEVVDLYDAVSEHMISSDGVHLIPEGYDSLAQTILTAVKPFLTGRKTLGEE